MATSAGGIARKTAHGMDSCGQLMCKGHIRVLSEHCHREVGAQARLSKITTCGAIHVDTGLKLQAALSKWFLCVL